jgi:hypothetical protein
MYFCAATIVLSSKMSVGKKFFGDPHERLFRSAFVLKSLQKRARKQEVSKENEKGPCLVRGTKEDGRGRR